MIARYGEDPRDIDQERADLERAESEPDTRPVVNDQTPTGEQGISSDRPGVDPGGYPGPRVVAELEDDETDETDETDEADGDA
jgi:hypothetical protein